MGNLTVKESGEMINIISPNINNITSFKVHFSPKQEGTGDPSPENVREIVGWNGVEGYKCGKNLAHIFGYGTQNIENTDVNKYKTTNTYGTTINTTIFNNPDTPLIIEQSQAPNSTVPSGYQNGYIAIGTDNLIFGQKYNVSFKVSNITNNILNISLNNIKLLVSNGASASVTEIIDDVLIFKNITFYQNTLTPKRQGFEIRICGLSFTLSEFMVTSVDNEDFTYEPYQGTELNINWTNNIKQWTHIDSSFDTYSSNIFNGYGNSLWDNAITDIPAEWFNKSLTYSVYIDRAESPYTPYDDARVWFYGDSTTMKEASSAYRITEPSSSGRSWVTFTIPEGTTKLALGLLISKGGRAYNPQLEYGEEPTEYRPYVGDVYGGYVDLVSGELVVEYESISALWNEWTFSENLGNNTRKVIGTTHKSIGGNAQDTSLCNLTNNYLWSNSNDTPHFYVANNGNSLYAILPNTLDEKQKVQISYKLAEPIYYQLTPQQLSTLKGQNNFWSNADYVEIEYELTETFDIQKAKQKIILNQPHVESASGDIVTFDTDMKGKLKECKVYFSPVQEGEGDPSPDNVRNIVGWNGVSVGLPSEYQEVEWIQSTEEKQFILLPYGFEETDTVTITASISTEYVTDKFIIAPTIWNNKGNNRFAMVGVYASMYCISYGNHSTGSTRLEPMTYNDGDMHTWTFANKTFEITDLGLSKNVSDFTFGGVTSNLKLFYGYNHNINGKLSYYKHIKLNGEVYEFIPCYRKSDGEIGLYDIKNHVFYTNDGTGSFLKGKDVNNITTNINWTDSVGTVYGGYVDLVSGELVQTHYLAEITTTGQTSINKGYDTTEDSIYFTIKHSFPQMVAISSNGNDYTYSTGVGILPADCKVNYLKPIFADNWRGTKNVNTLVRAYTYQGSDFAVRMARDLIGVSSEDSETVKAQKINDYLAKHPLQVYYKLETPIHYQFTPQQLLTLKGTNNIYSNTNGQTEIKYWKH